MDLRRRGGANCQNICGASFIFQSVHDATVVPEGQHTMSVFAQYVPYSFSTGSWDSRRDEVRRLALDSVGRFCSNLDSAVVDAQVLGPPDIEEKVGLTGGHIFRASACRSLCGRSGWAARTPDAGDLHVRSLHASGRISDWRERTECCDVCFEGLAVVRYRSSEISWGQTRAPCNIRRICTAFS